MKKFIFDGIWEFEYEFEAFKGLQSRRGIYNSIDKEGKSNGTVMVSVTDRLDEATDPLPQQLNAINYILENPDTIRNAIFTALDLAYPTLKEESGFDEADLFYKEMFPEVSSLEGYSNVFGVGNLFIHRAHKLGFSFVGLDCGCNWDEEHGLGFLMHKDKVIKIGQSDTSFNDYYNFEDNEDDQSDDFHVDSTLKLYEPNPKYGTLKPSQISINIDYANKLIENGFTEKFLDLLKISGSKYFPSSSSETVFLETALKSKNLKVVQYILLNFNSARENFIRYSAKNRHKKYVRLIIKSGVPLNAPFYIGRNLLKLTDEHIQFFGKVKCKTRYDFITYKKWLLQLSIE